MHGWTTSSFFQHTNNFTKTNIGSKCFHQNLSAIVYQHVHQIERVIKICLLNCLAGNKSNLEMVIIFIFIISTLFRKPDDHQHHQQQCFYQNKTNFLRYLVNVWPTLYHCTTTPLYHCTTTPLYHCTTSATLYHYTIVPLYHCTIVPLYRYTTVPLYHQCTKYFKSSI